MQPTLKFVPHRRYIKTAMLAGLPDDEINLLCSIRNYNVLPEYLMDRIRSECEAMPGGIEMMRVNHHRYKHGIREPYFDNRLLGSVKHKQFFVDLINMLFGSDTIKRNHPNTFRVLKILERRKERTYLEIAALQNEPLSVIVENYMKLITDNIAKVSIKKHLSIFYSYFWCVNTSAMRKEKCDIYDVSVYIDIDAYNKHYIPHRTYMYSTHTSLCAYLGLTDEIERRELNTELWGKIHMEIERSLNTGGKNIPKWLPDLFSKLNDTLIAEEEIKGMQYYRDKINEITQRAISLSNQRKTRDDLRMAEKVHEEAEQDEKVNPRERNAGD